MGVLLLSLLSVILFCLSAHCLLRAVVSPLGWSTVSSFSMRARRIERAYKIFSWTCLTLFLLGSMLQAFIEAFSQI
mgnify:CR=1 FL=1